MANSLYRDFGGTSFPATLGATETTLVSLDPARATLAALFKAALNAELGDAWRQIIATLPPTHLLRTSGTNPVNDVLEIEPSPAALRERRQELWPLLCVNRTGSARFDELTLNGGVERLIQNWDVHYILGPLDIGGIRKVADVAMAAAKVIRLVILKRGHPAYQNGALQFFPPDLSGNVGTLGMVNVTGYEIGQAQFAAAADSPVYYTAAVHLETHEHMHDDLGAFGGMDAIDLTEGVGDHNEILPAANGGSTDAPFQYG